MNERLSRSLSLLPNNAGVYSHLDSEKRIIYIGKAANLRKRVRQYFQHKKVLNDKDRRLVEQIADVRWTVTENSLQALWLESKLIAYHQPKYNVLGRSPHKQSWPYIVFDFNPRNPHLYMTQQIKGLQSKLLGPYVDKSALKAALYSLRRIFPYSTHRVVPKKVCLDYHLKLCPGPASKSFQTLKAQDNLRKVMLCLSGKQGKLLKQLKETMQKLSAQQKYESAAILRDQIQALSNLKKSIVFNQKPLAQPVGKLATSDLQALFNLKSLKRIEAYDVSHTSGQQTSASMIVAENGKIQRAKTRRFKARKTGNNDYAQMTDVLKRRLKSESAGCLPDLWLIDGGRGQVSAAEKALQESDLNLIPILGLAKKYERIVFRSQSLKLNVVKLQQLKGKNHKQGEFSEVSLPLNSLAIQFLQRLRDASHSVARNYHRKLHQRFQISSPLLEIEGIGPVTYKKLLLRFGSTQKLKSAKQEKLMEILNKQQYNNLQNYFKSQKSEKR